MKFIVFEGLDGAGKSTLIDGLSSEIRKRGLKVQLTREPGGTQLGHEIRQLLLKISGDAPRTKAETLLYQADRAQNVECLVRPALSRNEWVISDRYAASSVAFQCGGRGVPRAEIDYLNKYSTGDLRPDLYVLLDLTTEEAKRRMEGRDLDRFESEKQDFHERVRQSYLAQAKEDAKRWLVLDASLSKEKLHEQLMKSLNERKWL